MYCHKCPILVLLTALSSSIEIKKKIEQNWIRFLKTNSEKYSLGIIDGSSPPSVFVGSYGYPKVKVGPMVSPLHGDTSILDKTELWTGKSLEEIAHYRLSLILGTRSINVWDTSGSYLENIQEMTMSKKPTESEAIFDKTPMANAEIRKEFWLNYEVTPFGPSAPLRSFKISTTSPDQRIEAVYYDTDLRATEAMMKLYRCKVETSTIHRVLSMGMLGVKKKRKLVPSRWSISAADDAISGMLLKEMETNPSIDLYEVSRYSHLSNHYSIILIPYGMWSFEMIESWFTDQGHVTIETDSEDAKGLDRNPSIGEAYFAARLAVAEHLVHRHKKAAAIVFREVQPKYVMPLGVWQIREGIREALRKKPQEFEGLDRAISCACSFMSTSKSEVMQKSRLWKSLKFQTKLSDFT
jgi:DNA repair protein NreA